jgi:hypothetical protein
VTVVAFIGILIAYFVLQKKMKTSEYAQMKKLQQGTKANTFTMEVFYQKMYITFIKTPFLKRYILKIRRMKSSLQSFFSLSQPFKFTAYTFARI